MYRDRSVKNNDYVNEHSLCILQSRDRMKGVTTKIPKRITINFSERKLKLSQPEIIYRSQKIGGTTEYSSKLAKRNSNLKSIQNKLRQP